MKKLLTVSAGFLLSVFFNLSVTHALTLQFEVDAGVGQLVGATRVPVGALFFDVVFIEGSCETIFTECGGSIATIGLQNGRAGSIALLQQVFREVPGGPLIDSIPSLTRGCEGFTCNIITPSGFPAPEPPNPLGVTPGMLLTSEFINYTNRDIPFNEIMDELEEADFDTTLHPEWVYAVWTPVPVPEPQAILLMGSGLVALLALRKKIQTHGSSR